MYLPEGGSTLAWTQPISLTPLSGYYNQLHAMCMSPLKQGRTSFM